MKYLNAVLLMFLSGQAPGVFTTVGAKDSVTPKTEFSKKKVDDASSSSLLQGALSIPMKKSSLQVSRNTHEKKQTKLFLEKISLKNDKPRSLETYEEWIRLGLDIDGEAALDQSGSSVSISGDGNTVAIGAPYNAGDNVDDYYNSGHVRVYRYNETAKKFVQLGSDINAEGYNDNFGASVSISSDGNTVAIGALYNDGDNVDDYYNSGHVRVYKYNEIAADFEQLGSDIDGEGYYDKSGYSVSISGNGNTVAIGAPGNDGDDSYNSGHVRVYRYNEISADFEQLGSDIDGEGYYDKSGESVSISDDGNTVAIGAALNAGDYDDDYYPGHVRVFRYNEIAADFIQLGSDIDGEGKNDYSGSSVSISGDGNTVAIGAIWNDGDYYYRSGHVRVYRYNEIAADFEQLGSDIDGEGKNDYSGYSVSISDDGNTVAIGAPYNDGDNEFSGHVRVYRYNEIAADFEQLGSDIDGEGKYDNSGYSVSISGDGNTVAIGAPDNDGDNESSSGHVRVYRYKEIQECKDTKLKLQITNSNGKIVQKGCFWAAKSKTARRCSFPGVSAACPLTCGRCNLCVDPSIKFMITVDDNKVIKRGCDWVGRGDTNKISKRCKRTKNICRSTCGSC